MAVIGQQRNIDLKTVFGYPLGPIPWSLVGPLGEIKKTQKISLLHEFEKGVEPAVDDIDERFCHIFDAMAVVQKARAFKTFGDLAMDLFKILLRVKGVCHRIDVVFYVYREVSVKNTERSRRKNTTIEYSSIKADHPIKQWLKFLGSSKNKTALIEFLFEHWQKEDYRNLLGNKEMYLACEEVCVRITVDSVTNIEELSCTHEEADTRMILHAKHAADNNYGAVVIDTPHTDVFIIALMHSCHANGTWYIKTGIRNKRRFINLESIKDKLMARYNNDKNVSDMCDALFLIMLLLGVILSVLFEEVAR